VTEVDWEPARKKAQKAVVDLPTGTAKPSVPEELTRQVKWKKATTKSGPKLELPEGLDAALAPRLKALFPGNGEVQKAIDEALARQREAERDDEAQPEESGEG
jgi:hypothetical protein